MKIFFCNFYNGIYAYASGDPLAVGGSERQQWFLARALARAGWSVAVGLTGSFEFGRRTMIEGVQFISIGESDDGVAASIRKLASLQSILRSEAPDWWYWRCSGHLFGPAVALGKLTGVKTIFASAFDTDVEPRRALTERRSWWPLYAWGLSKTDRIFVQHGGQLLGLSSKLQPKAVIVRSIAHIPTKVVPHHQREKYIAWVGMLRQPKRPDLLLKIANKAQNLRFKICGGPTDHRSPRGYGAEIVEALKCLPNVEYLGQVTPDRAHDVIAEASALLCTSEGEGFPNTFLQAWANGTPTVTLAIDPDYNVERRRLGCVSDGWENAIRDLSLLLDSPEVREDMGHRARCYVMKNHSDAVVTRVFEQALGLSRSFSD